MVIKDDFEMKKKRLNGNKIREYYEKTMLELEKKNKREEYKYCLNQNGQ